MLETDVKQKHDFAVVSLNNKIYSVIRNAYYSSVSCFILFLFIEVREISLYSFFKSCHYELSFGNSTQFELSFLSLFTGGKKYLKKTLPFLIMKAFFLK